MSVVDPKGSGHNKHRYVVASQEQAVRRRMRDVVGVPLVYLKRSVMILEPMAQATEKARDKEERDKVRAGLKGGRGGLKRKREEDEERDAGMGRLQGDANGKMGAETPQMKKLKGVKGPNPLSVKKPKKDAPLKHTIAKEVEGERSTLRKATETDPQANEKALDAILAAEGPDVDGVVEGARKRKRKRKPVELNGSAPEMVASS